MTHADTDQRGGGQQCRPSLLIGGLLIGDPLMGSIESKFCNILVLFSKTHIFYEKHYFYKANLTISLGKYSFIKQNKYFL